MATSRRQFLKKGSLVALAASVPISFAKTVVGNEALPPSPAGTPLSKAAFEAQLNTTFRINRSGSKVQVKLVEVANLDPTNGARRGKEAFSLLFRGDRSTRLNQDTYSIDHSKLGNFSFLIVPTRTGDDRNSYYEAVINRLYP